MKVLFNASVVLAGLRSKNGASGELLKLVRKGELEGVISELIFDEIVRHFHKIGISKDVLERKVIEIFNNNIFRAPQEKMVEKYYSYLMDRGDAHILASYEQDNCETLVTLDKKHLPILQGKIKGLNIMSPGEFLSIVPREGVEPT